MFITVSTLLKTHKSFVSVNYLRMVLRVYVDSHYFVRVKMRVGGGGGCGGCVKTVAGGEARSCAPANRYKNCVARCALSRHSGPSVPC